VKPSFSMSEADEAAAREASSTRWLGTVLGLAAWTMFFVSLTFAVGWYRMREPWPSLPVHPLVLALPGLLLVAGSVVLHRVSRAVLTGPEGARRLLKVLGAAVILGLGFAGMQAGVTHVAWWNLHFRIPADGVPASAFYGLTALHVLHVLAVVAGVFFSAVRLRRGVDVREAVRRHALGWHFVTVMWLLLLVAVYLP
jgi:heme/copper-type cytochrome/quinol oxidase subunit 3